MIFVMLPAYNEEKALPLLLNAFSQMFASMGGEYRVVVVDDGSSDGTKDVALRYAEKMPLELVPHPQNMGLGAAMLTGFTYLSRLCDEDDLVVTMDADNTHDPALVPQMKASIEAGADVVIASRYADGGQEVGLTTHRKVLSRGASLLLSTAFPVEGARDYTCGYRMYRGPLLNQAIERYGDRFVTERSFVCMAEILIKIAYLPAKVDEVPLVLRYDLKEGDSKMKKIQTILRYISFIAHEKRHGLVRVKKAAGT